MYNLLCHVLIKLIIDISSGVRRTFLQLYIAYYYYYLNIHQHMLVIN